MDVRFSFPVFALILTCIIPIRSQGLKRESKACRTRITKDRNHICMKISSCSSAPEDIQKNIRPPVCGWNETTPFVCCTPKSALTIIDEMCHKYTSVRFPLNSNNAAGGDEAEPKEFPYMALLGYGDSKDYREWKCGGTLISERFVLTAAHCVREPPAVVRLGELNYETDTDDARPEDFTIMRIFVHPNYMDTSYYNDIALLKLDRDVKFNEYIRPICLSTENQTFINKTSIATGWGTLGPGLPLSSHLMKIQITILSMDYCQKYFGVSKKFQFGIDETSQVCAGELKGGIDTCVGDSGGPLEIEDRQIGITSFGDSVCAIKERPGVYTRVFNYLNWIQRIVWPMRI